VNFLLPIRSPSVRLIGSPRSSWRDYPFILLVFRQEEGAWTHKRTITIPRILNGDLCAMRGHVYTVGYSEGAAGVIHKFTLTGEHILSIGDPYRDPDPFIRSALSERGSLTCNSTHNTIAYRHALSPIIAGYSDSGVERWRVKLADADIGPVDQTFTDEDSPSIGLLGAPSRTGPPRFLSTPDPKSFLVTYGAVGGERRLEYPHLNRIHADSGAGAYAGGYSSRISEPLMMGLVGQNMVASIQTSFTQLGIYPYI